MTTLERLKSFLQYAVRAVLHGLQMPRPDLILGSSTPLTAAAAAAAVASLRDISWVFEVRDLWPDFPVQMGALPLPGLPSLLYGLERWLYRDAAHVVTLSPDMEKHVRAVTPTTNATTVTYGTDLRLVEEISEAQRSNLRTQFSLDRRFLVLYAGAFGRANAVPTLLETAKRFANRTDVVFAFAGQGYQEAIVQRAARKFKHIRHLPPLPYPDALTLFSLADVSLVSFIDLPVLAANSPGKLYDSLAAGTPVVVTNAGWTKRFVEAHHCGWYVPPESPKVLASHLNTLLDNPKILESAGQNASAVARTHFDRSQIMNRYADLINRV